MRPSRIAMVVSLLITASLGVYWVATAQDDRVPWPPPPVKVMECSPAQPIVPRPMPTPAPAPPAATEPKANANDSKGGLLRKWIGGKGQGASAEPGKGKASPGGIQQAGYKPFEQEPPPPIPPKLTVPPAMPPATESDPQLVPLTPKSDMPKSDTPKPIMPAPVTPKSDTPKPMMPPASPVPDLPTIPMPASPFAVNPGDNKPTAGEPKIALPKSPDASSAMPVADPPKADPIKSVITEPVQQTPGSGKPPAFVIISQKKEVAARAVVPPPTSPATGPGPVQPWAEPTPDAVKTDGTPPRNVAPPSNGAPLLGIETPPLTVEKRGPAMVKPGEPTSYQIVVRNLGTIAARQVRVEDELPADAKLVAAEPAPLVQNNRAVWIINELAGGASALLSMNLLPGPSGSMSHSTSVNIIAAASQTTTASCPPTAAGLVVQVVAPRGLAVGRQGNFEVTYANQGRQRISGVVLYALLSPGLRHPIGQSIEADIGDLEPGASKTIKVEASASQPGRQGMQVRVAAAGVPEATGHAILDVATVAAGLSVQQQAATRLFLGRTSDLRIDVTNNSGKPMRHVAVVSYLPQGVDFVAASERGNYQPNGRTVNWLVDSLAPGQTQALIVRVQGKAAGQQHHQVIARADGVPESKSTGVLGIECIADLAIALSGDNALEVGKEAVYEVRVGNTGSGANAHVRVEVTFAPGIVPRTAAGPCPYRIEGQTVVFDNLAMLTPQGQAVYRIAAMGESPGDRRVRVSVISDQVRTPATRETSTRVYRD